MNTHPRLSTGTKRRYALGRHSGNSHLAGFQIDLDEKGKIIEDRGDGGGNRYLGIGHVKKFRHDERSGAHDGRHDLTPVGSHRFHRGGYVSPIARANHHGNHDRSFHHDVRNRTP